MNEIGIDVINQQSKTVDEALMLQADIVITLCEPGKATCPLPPKGVQHVDWTIPGWEAFSSNRLTGLRALRDAIIEHVRSLIQSLSP